MTFWRETISDYYGFAFIMIVQIMLLHRNRTTGPGVRTMFHRLVGLALLEFWLCLIEHAIFGLSGTRMIFSLITHIRYLTRAFLLCTVLLISERDRTRREKFLIQIPLLTITAVVILSLPFGWISYYTEDNTYVMGPLHPVSWIVLLVYMGLIMASAVSHHASQSECIFLLAMESFIVFNILFELLLGGTRGMELTVTALAILCYYIFFLSQASTEYCRAKEKEIAQARMQAMISQIKPHFIYNSLACIAETCHEGAPEAEDAVLTFSAYLRRCFDSIEGDGLIPFAEELDTIEHYIALEKLQNPDSLTAVYEIGERNFSVPVLAVETLVENAVKHGLRKKRGGGTVTLRTFRDERGIVISVRDDGVGFDTRAVLPEGKHLGLDNACTRLKEQCGAELTVESRPGEGTEALIVMPEVKCG